MVVLAEESSSESPCSDETGSTSSTGGGDRQGTFSKNAGFSGISGTVRPTTPGVSLGPRSLLSPWKLLDFALGLGPSAEAGGGSGSRDVFFCDFDVVAVLMEPFEFRFRLEESRGSIDSSVRPTCSGRACWLCSSSGVIRGCEHDLDEDCLMSDGGGADVRSVPSCVVSFNCCCLKVDSGLLTSEICPDIARKPCGVSHSNILKATVPNVVAANDL